jgi:hypothetical protein
MKRIVVVLALMVAGLLSMVPGPRAHAGNASDPASLKKCHTVTKVDKNGKKTKKRVCHTVAPTFTPTRTPLPAPTFTPLPDIVFGKVTMFTGNDSLPQVASIACTAPGEQDTSTFRTSDPIFGAKLVIGNWRGSHLLTRQFLDPSGNPVTSLDTRLTNVPTSSTECAYMFAGGGSWVQVPGVWVFRILIDGVVVEDVPFKVVATNVSVLTYRSSQHVAVFREQTAPAPGTYCGETGAVQSPNIGFTDYGVEVQFWTTQWQGEHSQQALFTSPTGKVYDTGAQPYTNAGYNVHCLEMPVAGQAAATMPGTWSVQVLLDGNKVDTATFTIG